MRVGIDVRKLDDGGIGTYIRETVGALRRVAPGLELVAIGEAGGRERLAVRDVEWVDVRAGKYSLAEHWVLPRAAHGAGIDIFHAPHYVLPAGLHVPSVVTIHDLIHLVVPRSIVHPVYARCMISSACRRAGRVLAVSETTAGDLVSRLGIDRARIRVVPNAASPQFLPPDDDTIARRLAVLGVERPYVLFVGNALPHKNVPTLVRAWNALASPRPALVLCGGGIGGGDVQRAIAASGEASRVRLLGTVEPGDLVALYSGAVCLASASLYEGFWLPALEAMACGTPVLGPDAGAVPEVTGDAALLVPPERVDLLADGLYRLLHDPELRSRLVENGKRRITLFSWEESARKTLRVYEEVVSGAR